METREARNDLGPAGGPRWGENKKFMATKIRVPEVAARVKQPVKSAQKISEQKIHPWWLVTVLQVQVVGSRNYY